MSFGLINTLEITEERINQLKDMAKETFQTEKQEKMEKKKKKKTTTVIELQCSTCITGLSEDKRDGKDI